MGGDAELAEFDIRGSIAHARGLHAAGVLSQVQLIAIEQGLKQIQEELANGKFSVLSSDEDVHTAVERRLTEIDRDAGAQLHAGRSRNDQVALDLRLYCREATSQLTNRLAGLIEVLVEKAARHASWPMPGYTHLQRAQPVTVGHHLLAHAEPLLRDGLRLQHAYDAADELPLGSGALAGSTLPLQREAVARELGFARITANSMDAVSDRDFALDLAHACLCVSLHLSRFGEDVVLWASREFGFIKLADEVATGSSLMPQKKNPDIAELIRGRAGRAVGSVAALATVLKGLPLAYDRDLQEAKEPLYATVVNAGECLKAAQLLVEHLEFDRARLRRAVADADLYATDAAEILVASGVPFRDAHQRIGEQVRDGSHRPELKVEESLRMRDLPGAPNPSRVGARCRVLRREVRRLRAWAAEHPPRVS